MAKERDPNKSKEISSASALLRYDSSERRSILLSAAVCRSENQLRPTRSRVSL
ncbi:hypothetical protein PR003_g28412 [Phytophthora rubi]|uniref:Uncharacterized protein n=1 Tax=Phytophthora rubi TaxID=129364 RepID=A0A6A3H602_9STRA|nr:hypothetical protein PR002_g28841 [Phytophthora rubi]KAE8977994.1 hypothetical protein PR001_g24966 [Phytophthora rubi]KAE9278808.1 hypothetical protein PR003_g28412 [Phytophthora rubi]